MLTYERAISFLDNFDAALVVFRKSLLQMIQTSLSVSHKPKCIILPVGPGQENNSSQEARRATRDADYQS